jgi:hypothetical protein
MSSDFGKPAIRTYFVADVKCYLCGSVNGTIEGTSQPFPRTVVFRRLGAPADGPAEVVEWRRLRCARCGGPTFLDDPDIVTERMESYNWLQERPRRGRPPKRVVEERRRERELLELDSEAA